MRPVRPLLD